MYNIVQKPGTEVKISFVFTWWNTIRHYVFKTEALAERIFEKLIGTLVKLGYCHTRHQAEAYINERFRIEAIDWMDEKT